MKRTALLRIGAITTTFAGMLLVAASCGGSGGGDEVIIISRDFYEPCGFDEECPSSNGCFEVTVEYVDAFVTDTLCTNPCTFDDECALGGKCTTAGGGPLCYQRCIDDLDCWDGYACVDYDLDLDPVCLPF
jgi:hypothetical protein